jgi:hypothetical protein
MDSGDVECVVNMDSLRELREREAADGEEEKEGQREFAGRAGWCTTSVIARIAKRLPRAMASLTLRMQNTKRGD